jgi:hypothetical protein
MNILNFGGSVTLVCGTLMAFAGGTCCSAAASEGGSAGDCLSYCFISMTLNGFAILIPDEN